MTGVLQTQIYMFSGLTLETVAQKGCNIENGANSQQKVR